jgi:hypothetical protein
MLPPPLPSPRLSTPPFLHLPPHPCNLFLMLVAGDRFCGIYHRPTSRVLLYTKGGRGKGATASAYDLSDPQLQGLIEPDLWEQLQEEVELLEVGWGFEPTLRLCCAGVCWWLWCSKLLLPATARTESSWMCALLYMRPARSRADLPPPSPPFPCLRSWVTPLPLTTSPPAQSPPCSLAAPSTTSVWTSFYSLA